MNTITRTTTAAVLFALGSISGLVHADEVRTQVVRFTSIDAGSPAAARALYARLKMAAESACSDQLPDSRQLGMARAYNACLQYALEHAVQQVNRPLLSAYAAQHGVHPSGALTEIAANR